MEIEKKDNIYKSQELNIYTEQCDLFKMLSIPTFGIYSNDYAFLEQILILKCKSLPNNSPKIVQEQINYLNKQYPSLDIQYFHLTLSASTLFLISPENINHLSYTPLNFISHPYIFYNCQLNREHKSDVYCAAYIEENELDTIKQENGDTHLRVNPQCNIDDGQLKREVYIHLSGDGYPSISPNNCHLLINLNSQIINFYVITLGTYAGKIVKCFVGNYLIIPNLSDILLYKDINISLLKQKNKEELITDLILFKNKFIDIFDFMMKCCIYDIINNKYSFEIIKNKIIITFKLIFGFGMNDINDIIFGMIYFMIKDEEFLFYIKNKADEIYMKDLFPNIKNILLKKFDLEEKSFDEIIDKFSKIKKKSNPNIELLINICNDINNKKNFSIDNLDDIFKNYLFFIVWEYKGKISGIHNDFGKVSLMRINEIDSKFFCNDEDRIKCCQELIQRLIDADEKKF